MNTYFSSKSNTVIRNSKKKIARFNYIILVLYIFAIFYIRFFTENWIILPRIFQFIDLGMVLLTFILIVTWILRGKRLKSNGINSNLLIGYIFILLISSTFNIMRLDPAVLGTYLLLQFGPLVFFVFFLTANFNYIVIKKILKIIFFTAIIQIIFSIFQVPKALAQSPDWINGTFGWNSTQMLCFLSTFLFCVLSYFRVTRNKKYRKIIIFILMFVVFIFYIASWRALWISFPLTIIILFSLAKGGSHKIKQISLIVGIMLIVFSFFYQFTSIYGETYSYENKRIIKYLNFNYKITDIGKVRAFLSVFKMYGENPGTLFWGAGPGTYGSRAYKTFALSYGGKTDVTAGFVKTNYSTDVAEKYLYKYGGDDFRPITSSSTLHGWQSSYVSLLGETGILGFFFVIGIYISLFKYLYRLHQRSFDPLSYSLTLGLMGSLIFLAQVSIFDDYLATFRVTLPTWMLIAVTIHYFKLNADKWMKKIIAIKQN
ncbi:MAG: hypothetical protein JXR46_00490 [Calditrichaceae bacterium]|nr:hypothetical protein [Calditrichaceae bacterium]MBN2707491.1 hypothetical protein [Calditrichaceae bacterium]RQV95582.1 MAG: hypothetical protein EH224_06895 [Calditrichota bacterium]